MFELEMGELCKHERRNPDRHRSEVSLSDVDAGTIGSAAPAPDLKAMFWSVSARDERVMEALGV
jgi:hypothetical protein